MPWFDSFRKNLSKTIERNGVSQAELARRSGIHSVTISRIICGHTEPTISTAEKLAIAAGMSAESIFRENFPESRKTALTAR